MTESTISRHCGNCGQPVGEGDVTCPHCNVLLAAYEAPAGATYGTASATTPVSMTAEPSSAPIPPTTRPSLTHQPPVYYSPTADAMEALEGNRQTPLSATPAFDRPRPSPVTGALEPTRAAIDEPVGDTRQPDTLDSVAARSRRARAARYAINAG